MDTIIQIMTYKGLRNDQIVECNQSIERADRILREFPQVERLDPLMKGLAQQMASVKQAWQSLQSSRTTVSQLSPAFILSDSGLTEFKKEKAQSFSRAPSTRLSELSSFLTKQLNGITTTSYKKQLLEAFEKVNASTTGEVLDNTYQELTKLVKSIWESENQHLDSLRQQAANCDTVVKKSITDSHEINPYYINKKVEKIQKTLRESQEHIQKMHHWTHELKDIPMLNISLSDMEWLKDYAQSFAYTYVKKEVDGLIRFARRPHNTRFGIFHHSIFLPFINANKK